MKFLKTMTLAASVSVMSFSPLASAADPSYGVIFMDRSGSMMTTRPDGQTRCAYSQQIAMQKVSRFFWNPIVNGQKLDIKTFSSGGQLTSITNGFTDFGGAVMALSQLDPQSCGGSTALAEAACLSADALRDSYTAAANNGALLRVYGSTDGGENSSPIANCGGAAWQAEVWLRYHNVNPDVQFNIDIYYGNVQKAARKASANYEQSQTIAEDVGYGTVLKSTPPSGLNTFDFMKQLATSTGGEVREISDVHGDNGNGEW